jgi:hypothetical protein
MGTGVRLGSVTGFANVGGEEAIAIGGQVAVGRRFGPAAVEAELDALKLAERTYDFRGRRGEMFRLGVTGRLDMIRLGVGPRSLLILFVEGGVGRQRTGWNGGATGVRTDTHAGMGWLLDHRGRRARLLPAVGWHVSWRFTGARSEDATHMTRGLCRGKDCVAPEPAPDYDIGLLVSSGLMVSW